VKKCCFPTLFSFFSLSKNNTPVSERKSGENGGEIDHFFNVFNIFSPRSRLVISSQRKTWENDFFP
jgi:hypothetical protein